MVVRIPLSGPQLLLLGPADDVVRGHVRVQKDAVAGDGAPELAVPKCIRQPEIVDHDVHVDSPILCNIDLARVPPKIPARIALRPRLERRQGARSAIAYPIREDFFIRLLREPNSSHSGHQNTNR